MMVFSPAVVIGIIVLLLFIFQQRKLDEPLLDTAIFRNRMFTGGTITAGLMMFNVAGVELMTTQRFQTAADFSALQAGALVASVAVLAVPAALLGGSIRSEEHTSELQ